jgi:hypothetical protein
MAMLFIIIHTVKCTKVFVGWSSGMGTKDPDLNRKEVIYYECMQETCNRQTDRTVMEKRSSNFVMVAADVRPIIISHHLTSTSEDDDPSLREESGLADWAALAAAAAACACAWSSLLCLK